MEEAIGLPGWVSARLDGAFEGLGVQAGAIRGNYAECLGAVVGPGPSDLLGAECERCRAAVLQGLAALGLAPAEVAAMGRRLEAVEAELAEES